MKAARQFEPLDSRLARETYLDALAAAQFAGRLALGGGMREVAEAARMAPPPPRPARPPDLLLDGLALLVTEGYPAGAPVLRQAVSAFRGTDVSREEELRWLWLASRAARMVWDYDSWDVLSDRQVTLASDAGALIALPIAFNTRAGLHVFSGEFTEAASMVAQAESVTEAIGSSIAPYGTLALAVFRGREAEAAQLTQTAIDDVRRRGEGAGLNFVDWATAVLYNSLGRYEEALAAAQRASEDSPAMYFTSWALVELVEAAVRSGVPERAAGALQRLSDIARASGTDWAVGTEARSRALVSDGEDAENLYREAIDRLGRTRLRVDLARAHLVYGEWLRRQRRRRDARDQLGIAYEIFDSVGAAAFADRARTELRATGGNARQLTIQTPDTLTAQEALIARLAGEAPPTRRSPRSCSSAPPPSPTTCAKSSPSSASAPAASSLPRSPPGKAQHRWSRRRADPRADPRPAAAAPAWPAIKTLPTTGSRVSTLADAHRYAANLASMSYLKRRTANPGCTADQACGWAGYGRIARSSR